MPDIPAEISLIHIACNKSGGCRIVLPESLEEFLAIASNPSSPWRLFRPTGWAAVPIPVSFELLGSVYSRNVQGAWCDDAGIVADAHLAAALSLLEASRRAEVLVP